MKRHGRHCFIVTQTDISNILEGSVSMNQMDIITKLIPVLLVVCIVYFNMRRIQKNLKEMKKEQNGNTCSGSCAGCTSHCSSAQKETENDEK